jgi:hypothetical protein
MSGLHCTKCEEQFNLDKLIPLVLPCGDSVCMSCLLKIRGQSYNLHKCTNCSFIFEVSNKFISELPKNKAILSLVSSNGSYQRNGPLPKVLFANTPEPKRITSSPVQKPFVYYTPSSYQHPVTMSSPNSVAIKCSRPGCNKDRYFYNGEVWDYCCLNCKEMDRVKEY